MLYTVGCVWFAVIFMCHGSCSHVGWSYSPWNFMGNILIRQIHHFQSDPYIILSWLHCNYDIYDEICHVFWVTNSGKSRNPWTSQMKSPGSQGQISTRNIFPPRSGPCGASPGAATRHGAQLPCGAWGTIDIVPDGHRIHRCVIYIYRGFLKQGGPPKSSKFSRIFHKPSSYWGIPIYGHPHIYIYMNNIVGICWHIFAESICSIFWGLWDRSTNKCWLASWNPFHAARYRIRCAET